MSLSLNLPFSVCYPLTLLARRRLPKKLPEIAHDQRKYFLDQYQSTQARYQKFIAPLHFAGKTVLDIGCGLGGRSLGWLDLEATRVVNIDINRQELAAGRETLKTVDPDRSQRVSFRHPDDVSPQDYGDVAILFDSFEHLTDPSSVLDQVFAWLRPGSQLWIGSIGWYNYMASHCTGTHIPIPWCQLLFSEAAILKTIRTLLRRPDYVPNLWEEMEGLDRWDNVETLKDRPGEPLNMLSLRQIRKVMRASPFDLVEFQTLGFGGKSNRLARFAAPLAKRPFLDEIMHSYYTALLVKPE